MQSERRLIDKDLIYNMMITTLFDPSGQTPQSLLEFFTAEFTRRHRAPFPNASLGRLGLFIDTVEEHTERIHACLILKTTVPSYYSVNASLS